MALAAEGSACCAQSGALRYYQPKGIAKTTLSLVYPSYISRICIVEDGLI